MAGSDDDIEKLLREVEGSLGGRAGLPAPREPGKVPRDNRTSTTGRLEHAVLPAAAIGAVCAAPVWVVFSILPFVSGWSGGLGAFAAGFMVSLVGRFRRGA